MVKEDLKYREYKNCVSVRFRVKGKEGVEDPKSSLNMVIFQSNYKFGSKFWISPVEDDVFLINARSKCSQGTKMEP